MLRSGHSTPATPRPPGEHSTGSHPPPTTPPTSCAIRYRGCANPSGRRTMADNDRVSVAVIGHTGWDVVSTPTEATQRRLGGTPLYAARALRAVGVEPVVITKGAELPDASCCHRGTTFESVLVHSPEATDQQLAAVGEPFTPSRSSRNAASCSGVANG